MRFKACFKHHQAIPLFPESIVNKELEEWFTNKHRGCTIQVVNKNEIMPKTQCDKKYEII